MPMGIGPGLSVTRGGSVTGIGAIGADLALWFDENQAYKSSGGGIVTPDSILTYTAPSPKLVYGSDGVLRYAPHNLMQNSNWAGSLVGDDFTPTNWGLINSTGTATAQASAASTSDNAVRFQTSTTREVYGQNIAMVTGDRYRFSFDLEAIPTPVNWNQIFNVATVTISVETYNGETSNGSTPPVATSGRVYIDFSVTAGGTGAVRFGCGVTSNVTGDVTVARPMLQKLPFVGSTYVRNTSTSAAFYSLPRDHNPTTGAALGVLVEEARTNLLTYSEQFDNAAWTKSRSSISANATVAPDGTTTADKLVENTDTNNHDVRRLTTAISAGATTTFSLYVKKSERDYVAFAVLNGANGFRIVANLTTGVVDATYYGLGAAFGTGVYTSSAIQDVGNGWYRIALTGSVPAAASLDVYVYTATSTTTNYAGDGTSGIYLWGAQLE